MKYFLIYCICAIQLWLNSFGQAEIISVCPLPVSVVKADIDPIQTALDSIKADAANLAVSNTKKNEATKALEIANNEIKTLTEKLVSDRALLNKLLDSINVPPPEIQIIEVYSDGCAYCDSDATIASYVKEGLPIVKTKDAKWKVTATPTFIAVVNGKEVSRVVGILSKDKLFQWHKDLIAWSKG